MCLIKIHKFPRIAFKDIVVYKQLRVSILGIRTPYRHISIIPGVTTIKSAKSILYGVFKEIIEEEGVHAYLEQKLFCDYEIQIFKAIIPKWSLYYMGKDHDIAASKMFITDKCL